MKAITFVGPENVACSDVDDPAIDHPDDVVIRVTHAGICGSDLHPYSGRETGIDPGTVMGHEAVGEIVAMGTSVRRWAVGDRVVTPFTTNCGACYYCGRGLTARCERGQLFGWVEGGIGLPGVQAEFARVPLADATLVRVPADMPTEIALLAGDVLSTAVFGADSAAVGADDTVVVVGAGPVGVLAVLAARVRGARSVIALDRIPDRLALAASFGAIPIDVTSTDATPVVQDHTAGRGADCAIEAVGTAEATRLAVDLLRPGGRIAAVGVHTEPHLAIPPGELYDRNLTYAAGRCSARHYLPSSLDLAKQHVELLSSLISHRIPLGEGPEGYRMFAERREGCTKVVLQP